MMNTKKQFKAVAVAILSAAMALTGCMTLQAQEETELQTLVENEVQTEDSYNLLMVGSDHRDDSWNGNSDVMILATINTEAKQIVITSFMRDLYADIPGHGVHKLNYAYAVGGGEKLMETLEDNYQIEIDNYAVVDFDSMSEIIDMLGGVEITVEDSECRVLNSYLDSMNASEYHINEGGTYQLNGRQAVAYMRIRYVGNADYQRTQRQRDVLKEIFASMKNVNAAEIGMIAEDVMAKVEHNIAPLQMIELMAMVPSLTEYELVENRIPYDDLYYSQNGLLVPDFEATIARLHETLGITE